MIEKQRVRDTFLDMVKISSASRQERRMADYLINYMNANGIEVYEDEAGKTIGGTAGNVIAFMPGNGKKRLLFSAHMDTVLPCENIQPKADKDIITSDQTTVLGGDDKCGIAAILELIQQLKKKDMERPDLIFIFSIAEEIGLCGAEAVNKEQLGKIDACYVLDTGGAAGGVVYSAPYHAEGNIIVTGKAAHAGGAPEQGVNALVVASHAISSLCVGRIDEETTCNFGVVEGGLASNIVMPSLTLTYEARSLNKEKLEDVIAQTRRKFAEVCESFHADVTDTIELQTIGYEHDLTHPVIQNVKRACHAAGIPCNLRTAMGASDANVYNAAGIPSVVLADGDFKAHTKEEYADIHEVCRLAQILYELVKLS